MLTIDEIPDCVLLASDWITKLLRMNFMHKNIMAVSMKSKKKYNIDCLFFPSL